MTPRAARLRTRAGFTLIEVLIASAVFLVGLLGVTFMQGASVRSNQDAYESMVATNFARQWLERIRRDALGWTAPGAPNPIAMFSTRGPGSGTYFVPTGPGVPADSGLWPLDAFESTGASYHGFEVGQLNPMLDPTLPDAQRRVAIGDIYYCAYARFQTTSDNDLNGQLSAMTATVAVWWNRKESLETTVYDAIPRARQNGCDGAGLTFDVFADPVPVNIRRVRLVTALRWTPP